MQGRKPKPTILKLVAGNPGRRKLNENEPAPEAAIRSDPPEHLNDIGKKEWNIIFDHLQSCGLVSKIDLSALGAYCTAYARWVEAEESLKTSGMLIKTTNGNVVQSPYIGISNTALGLMHKFLAEFGMTPASRSRVSAGNEKPAGNKFASNGKKAAKG